MPTSGGSHTRLVLAGVFLLGNALIWATPAFSKAAKISADVASAPATSPTSKVVHWPRRWSIAHGDPAEESPAQLASPAMAAVVVLTAPAYGAAVQPATDGAVVSISRAADALGEPIRVRPTLALESRPANERLLGGTTFYPSTLPLRSAYLTSRFGYRNHPVLGGVRLHGGVDLAAPIGSPIVATSAGLISTAGWQGGYGLLVAIDHGGGVQTRYGHLSRLNVATGQFVRAGEVIGYVGSTGRSTGPHLHYELRLRGQAVNPLPSH